MKQKQPVQEDQKKDQMDGTSPEPEEATFSGFGTCERCMAVGWEDYILVENT